MCGEGFEEERKRGRETHKTDTNPWLQDSPQLCLNVYEPFSDGNCCSEALRGVCLMVLSDQLEYAHLFG